LSNRKHSQDHRSSIAQIVNDAGAKEIQGKDQTPKNRMFSQLTILRLRLLSSIVQEK